MVNQREQEQSINPKLDKKHFLRSQEGKFFIIIIKQWYYLEKSGQIAKEDLKIAVNLLLFTLRYYYGVNYDIYMDNDGFILKLQEGTDAVYTYIEKE